MNLLFITLANITDIDSQGIYEDLLREFVKNRNKVYVVSPIERRYGIKTHIVNKEDNEFNSYLQLLKVKTGNIQKTNNLEKGISTIFLKIQLWNAIKSYFKTIKFDLILYSTPPITIVNLVKRIKKRDNARTYLLLKDIFPQNAVDLSLFKVNGFIHKYFRNIERHLYAISDRIGCMSPANVKYLLDHNPSINTDIVEVCPNAIELNPLPYDESYKLSIRNKYRIPLNKTVFVYGGNFGKPQNIPFIIECLKTQLMNDEAYFLLIGAGTEYKKLENFIKENKPRNIKLFPPFDVNEYNKIISACDIGMIFLDYRFTIPNFPSRFLGYLQARLPVLACTDEATDIGRIIIDNNIGWWCKSNDSNGFSEVVKLAISEVNDNMKENTYEFLSKEYDISKVYNQIMEGF